jgi:hypothetical protein
MTKTRDLADLGGGFIQAGTGATQRTVESKLQDVVSVNDFNGSASLARSSAISSGLILSDSSDSYTITVGAGGNFSTLNAAIIQAVKMRPLLSANQSRVTIQLLAGFVMAEQVLVRNQDLSWITVTGVDAVTTVTPSAITALLSADIGIGASVFGFDNAKGFVIDQLFNAGIALTAVNGINGLVCINGATCTVNDGGGFAEFGGGVGAFARAGSVITAKGCSFIDNRIGIYALDGSVIDAGGIDASQTTDCSGSDWYGVYCSRSSRVNFQYGTATGCHGDSIRVIRGSSFNGEGANLSGCLGDTLNNPTTVYGAALYSLNSVCEIRFSNCSSCAGPAVLADGASAVDCSSITATNCNSKASFSTIDSRNGSTVNANTSTITGSLSTVAAVGARDGSSVNFNGGDCSNSSGYGLYSFSGSRIAASAATATGCSKSAAYCRQGSVIDADSLVATGCTDSTAVIWATRASEINFQSGNCTSRTGTYGVRSSEGSKINAINANCGPGTSNDITIANGSVVSAFGSTGSVPTTNTVSAAGIVYK